MVKNIFPQMVWRDGERRLWNPIHRKALKNRPEERVRLRTIEALIKAGWSRHRISTEEAIGQLADKARRTDIIGYTQAFDPKFLVECKAEHIKLSSQTAEQVSRYNQKVGAPYILITNGITDFWYKIDKEAGSVRKADTNPDFLALKDIQPSYNFEAWQERGFAGAEAEPELRKWLEKILPVLWTQNKEDEIRYLRFKNTPSNLDVSHYYCIHPSGKNSRLAISVMNTAYGGNRLIVVLNEANENRAMVEVNLNLVFEGQLQNATFYSADVKTNIDLGDYFDLKAIEKPSKLFTSFNKLFEQIGVN